MYQSLLYTHSLVRYLVLILLIAVIVRSCAGWLGQKSFTKSDDKLSLFLLIFTHLQLLIGLVLYYASPFVKFNSMTMKDPTTRYWSVEHIFMMLLAVALITFARISHKRMTTDSGKFQRLFYLNAVALLIIVVSVAMSGRGILGSSVFSN